MVHMRNNGQTNKAHEIYLNLIKDCFAHYRRFDKRVLTTEDIRDYILDPENQKRYNMCRTRYILNPMEVGQLLRYIGARVTGHGWSKGRNVTYWEME
jgi:hypothetical protein